MQGPRRGVLLLNLGTPAAPTTPAVRAYLREFLMDEQVIDLPFLPRWLLVNTIIAPFRAPKSAHAYASIWTEAGSPLLVHMNALVEALQARLGRPVALGMRYGAPSIDLALDRVGAVDELDVVPLYPQYATATTKTALDALFAALARRRRVPAVRVLRPLGQDPRWLAAQARQVGPIDGEHVVFTFHGLPERHVLATDPGCALGACCERPEAAFGFCYRAQCLHNARQLAAALGAEAWTAAFQSRLGRARWLGPSLVEVLDGLAARKARVVVVSPSFVADNLETLEEAGIQGRERFLAAGGAGYRLVPGLNAEAHWVEALAGMIGEPGRRGDEVRA